MLYRTLGRTGQKVSLLSYGSGGPSQFGARTGVDRAGRHRLIRRMLDLGVNLFDTAEGYGNSEEWLGDALQGADRNSYLIATKWGPPGSFRVGDEDNFTGLAESFERSLRRLKTDYIDIMQFHGVNMTTYGTVVDRYYPILKGLQEQGKLRFIGATFQLKAEPRHETAVHALRSDPDLWDTIMLKYGFLNQWAAKEVFPLAIEHGVGVLNMAAVRISLTRSQRSRGGRRPVERGGIDRAGRPAGRRAFRLADRRRRGLGDLRRLQVRRGPPGGFDGHHGHVEHRAFRGQRKVAGKAVVAACAPRAVGQAVRGFCRAGLSPPVAKSGYDARSR